ncbi:hypothetical protein DQ04_02571030 [Trypanosoma grayi]|uniref:hypothetical protein n=1 Tax=Trypanosoma grayi TaxID=71804 RepID=UPI0004F49CB1|nr:hypothetical protein DQ04_02571030 [Trypanosoma grayi]KEG11485.1 hypothetical protein DQ04_02571030 [Trypanosoma grayi]
MLGGGHILSGVARGAPHFLLLRLPSVLLGMAAGYCSILLLFGPLPFVYGVVQLLFTAAIAWGLATAARVGIEKGTALLQRWMLDGRGIGSSTTAIHAHGEKGTALLQRWMLDGRGIGSSTTAIHAHGGVRGTGDAVADGGDAEELD